MNDTANALIQGTIPETLGKIVSALNDVKSQFVFEDTDINSVQISTEMCSSIVDALSQIEDAIGHASTCIDTKLHSGSVLLKKATTLCNDMDELMAVHHYFYRAVEDSCSGMRKNLRGESCLPVFSQWLARMGRDAVKSVYCIQEELRSVFIGNQ